MPRTVLLTALPLILAASAVQAQAVSPLTTEFIAKASSTDAFEIEAGHLAATKSQNADVRAFANMMVTDHTATTNDLRQVLTKDKLPMPGHPSPDPSQAKLLTDLKDSEKKGFDRAYVHTQVMAHEAALKLMKTYAATGDNPDLKAAATKTAPMVAKHLEMARKLEFAVGGTTTGVTRHED